MVSVGNKRGEKDGTQSTSFENKACNIPMTTKQPKQNEI